MRRALLLSALFIVIVTGCAPAAGTEASEIMEPPEATSPAEEDTSDMETLGAAEQAAIEQLATNLGVEVTDITFLSSEETEFGDDCLDVAIEGMLCAQVATPGRIIILEADGVQYAYHTSEDGSRVQPVTPALVWKREGGIAGFCDTLTVFRSGEVFAGNCKSQAEGIAGSLATLLSAQEREQFNAWMADFGEANLDDSDPEGVSDRMEVMLKLVGAGEQAPSMAEQQELFEFAQDLYQKLTR